MEALRRSYRFSALLAAVFGGLLVLAEVTRWEPLQELERRSWDLRLHVVTSPAQADHTIVLALVDQGTLDFFEKEYGLTWPFPRSTYAHVIRFFENAGARALGFDMLFTESHATAVEGDQDLGTASGGKMPVVHAAAPLFEASGEPRINALHKFLESNQSELQGDIGALRLPEYADVTLPVPEILRSTRYLGSVGGSPDPDGVFRRYPVGASIQGTPLLSMPFVVARAAGDRAIVSPDLIAPDSSVIPFFHGPGSYREVPLAAVVQSEMQLQQGLKPLFDPKQFHNSIVLVGVWAPGLLDIRPNPLDPRGRGIEIAATVLDNLLHENLVRRLSLNWTIPAILVAVLCGAQLALGPFALMWQILLLTLLGLSVISSSFWLCASGVWVTLASPLLGLVLTYGVGSALRARLEKQHGAFLRDAFKRYVSGELVNQIVSNPDLLALGGERRELTMFFSDIKGFTKISEQLPADQLAIMLNEYLSLVSEVILEHRGTIDKYVGDAVVAFWNAPLADTHHADNAIRATVAVQEALSTAGPSFEKRFGVRLHTRIGIHTGNVSVGNFGSSLRFSYTMIGDAANLASRLEGANKRFGTWALISSETVKRAQDEHLLRRIGSLKVVGRAEPVTVYEPHLPGYQNFELTERGRFEQMLNAFEQGDIAAVRALLPQLSKNDPVVAALSERIDAGVAGTVWELTEK